LQLKKKELQDLGVTRFTGLNLSAYKELFTKHKEVLMDAIAGLQPTIPNKKSRKKKQRTDASYKEPSYSSVNAEKGAKVILRLENNFIGRAKIVATKTNSDVVFVLCTSLFKGYNNRKSVIEHKHIEPDCKFKWKLKDLVLEDEYNINCQ